MSEGLLTIVVCVATLLLMLAAFHWARYRWFHIPTMVSLIAFDLAMPIYLFLRRDWYDRLIVHEDVFTFGVWMHFMVILVLYIIYVFQILTARQLLSGAKGSENARRDHRNQAKAILLTRALVIATGALLYEPAA